MSKSRKDYRCEIDNINRPILYYKDKIVQSIPYNILSKLKCVKQPILKSEITRPIYLSLLPNDLRKLLIDYLSGFELLEAFNYSNEKAWGFLPITVDNDFWKNKLLNDFNKQLRKNIKVNPVTKKEYGLDWEDLMTEGNMAGWKNLYTIFTYADNAGKTINSETTRDFQDIAYLLAIPQLLDAYMSPGLKGDFLTYLSNEKSIVYIWEKYPQYRKILIFKWLMTNPEYLIEILTDNPNVNIPLMDIAKLAQQTHIDDLIGYKGQEFDDHLRYIIEEFK